MAASGDFADDPQISTFSTVDSELPPPTSTGTSSQQTPADDYHAVSAWEDGAGSSATEPQPSTSAAGEVERTVVKTKLFVGNIARETTRGELHRLFAPYGEVAECVVVSDYGFVHYYYEEEANAALRALDKFKFRGKPLKVQKSTSFVRKRPNDHLDQNTCFVCGKEGHWARDCQEIPEEEREKHIRRSQVKYSGGEDGDYDFEMKRKRRNPHPADLARRPPPPPDRLRRRHYDDPYYDDYYDYPPPPPRRRRPPTPDYYDDYDDYYYYRRRLPPPPRYYYDDYDDYYPPRRLHPLDDERSRRYAVPARADPLVRPPPEYYERRRLPPPQAYTEAYAGAEPHDAVDERGPPDY